MPKTACVMSPFFQMSHLKVVSVTNRHTLNILSSKFETPTKCRALNGLSSLLPDVIFLTQSSNHMS